ncbi:MAG TPA: rod shape-determining protein MreC [Actinomycetota bacterium]|nr:rod shape-determining protein MreC [Actinomycetota bacterium]
MATRRTTRPRFTLALLVLTSITLITLDYRSGGSGVTDRARGLARDAFEPVGRGVGNVLSPVVNVIGGVLDFGRIKDENARLRDELARARADAAAGADARRELKTALDALDLEFVGDLPSVAARVTGGAFSPLQLTVEIDKGTEAGVDKGMPVVSGGSLVGRVVQVGPRRSTILVVSDPGLSVGVRLSSTGDLGVVTGDGGRRLVMSLVEPKTEVKVGEEVVTSGLQQSQYPPGLPVGKVTSVKRDGAGLTQDVLVTSTADLRRLSFVRVLQWRPA